MSRENGINQQSPSPWISPFPGLRRDGGAVLVVQRRGDIDLVEGHRAILVRLSRLRTDRPLVVGRARHRRL